MEDLALRKWDELTRMVLEENLRQLTKWGIQDRSPCAWLAITTEEHGEMARAIFEYEEGRGSSEEVIREAIQAATLSLKIAEMFIEVSYEGRISEEASSSQRRC